MKLIFDRTRLMALASKHRESYVTNEPFPHTIIDGFLPESVAKQLAAEFPTPGSLAWREYDWETEVKLAFRDETQLDDKFRELLYQLNAASFLEFLELLTDITGLISDPYFEGGGLHQIEAGGFLDIHADFSYHSKLGLRRRVNALIYLNENWREEYGGHLELWDREMKACVRRIAPLFNRCVIFNTDDFAYHGHPTPLQCPPGVTRKSLALYYYSNDVMPHLGSPGDHSTLFQARPGENVRSKYSRLRRIRRDMKAAVLLFLPPIACRAYEALRRYRYRSGRSAFTTERGGGRRG